MPRAKGLRSSASKIGARPLRLRSVGSLDTAGTLELSRQMCESEYGNGEGAVAVALMFGIDDCCRDRCQEEAHESFYRLLSLL